MIMIYDGEDALFVDVSLCLNAWKPSLWLHESKVTVMVLGYLELTNVGDTLSSLLQQPAEFGRQKPLPIPLLHAHAPPVDVNPRLVLRAIVVEEARDLDLDLWNRAIRAQEDTATRKRNRAIETQKTQSRS